MLDDLHPSQPPPRGDIPLADALRALPLQLPPRSAWPALAAALANGHGTLPPRILNRQDAMPVSPTPCPPPLAQGRGTWRRRALFHVSGRRHPPRYWPWALAASLALAVGSAGYLRTTPEAMMEPTASAVAPMRELLLESAQLEALIARSSDISTSAPMMALSTDLEDQLALIDAQLGGPAVNPDNRLSLWQQRVRLLRELAGLQATQQWLATRGEQNTADALVYTY